MRAERFMTVRYCVILLLLWSVCGCWRRMSAFDQSYFTAASIQTGITSDFNEQIKAIGGAGEKWKILDDSQYDALVLRITKYRDLSGPPGWKPGMVLMDAWGKRFHVAVKQDDVVVWSNGADGIENTTDDVISPQAFSGKLP